MTLIAEATGNCNIIFLFVLNIFYIFLFCFTLIFVLFFCFLFLCIIIFAFLGLCLVLKKSVLWHVQLFSSFRNKNSLCPWVH